MPTRIVVMSDIHGNLPALQAVAASLPDHDAVFVAGDLCLEGPSPDGVIDFLSARGWIGVAGNTDRDIVEPSADLGEADRRMVEWARVQLGPERIAWLAGLPFSRRFERDGERLLVVHANPLNLEDQLYPDLSQEQLQPFIDAADADILAFGHLHIPYVRPAGSLLLIDVSSVGHPKDRDLRAAYTVITWDGAMRSVEQVRVPYDVHETVRLMHVSGMPDAKEEAGSLLRASY